MWSAVRQWKAPVRTGLPPACAKGLVYTWDTWAATRLREGLRDPETAAKDGMALSFQG